MNKRIFVTLQIGLISFFMFADQNLMGPNLTLIAEDFGITDMKDQYLGGLIPLVFWILGGSVALFIGYCTDLMSRKNLFTLIVFIGEIPCLLSGFADTYAEFFYHAHPNGNRHRRDHSPDLFYAGGSLLGQ